MIFLIVSLFFRFAFSLLLLVFLLFSHFFVFIRFSYAYVA